jgi:hypothetical protein
MSELFRAPFLAKWRYFGRYGQETGYDRRGAFLPFPRPKRMSESLTVKLLPRYPQMGWKSGAIFLGGAEKA